MSAKSPATDLTGRQREVAALVASGKTNAEIGAALGISLDGAKYHVSELMAKLGVDSREEIAHAWRQQNGIVARLSRPVRHIGALGWKAALVSAATVSAAAIAVALVVAGGDDEQPGSNPSPVESPPAMATPAPSPSPGGTLQAVQSQFHPIVDAMNRGDADALFELVEVERLTFRDGPPVPVDTVCLNDARIDRDAALGWVDQALSGNRGELSFVGQQGDAVHLGFALDEERLIGGLGTATLYLLVDWGAPEPIRCMWQLGEQTPADMFRSRDGDEGEILFCQPECVPLLTRVTLRSESIVLARVERSQNSIAIGDRPVTISTVTVIEVVRGTPRPGDSLTIETSGIDIGLGGDSGGPDKALPAGLRDMPGLVAGEAYLLFLSPSIQGFASDIPLHPAEFWQGRMLVRDGIVLFPGDTSLLANFRHDAQAAMHGRPYVELRRALESIK